LSTSRHRIHPDARAELRRAAERYRAEGTDEHGDEYGRKLASRFRDEVKRALASVLDRPRQWPIHLHGTRRKVLRTFPFSIVYLVGSDDAVFVIAIAHHAREPGYWKKRSR
jgi:plasmid stabilization system protein ParE